MKLTKAAVSRLALPSGKSDAIYFDDEVRGFGIRLRSGGKRTWIAQYKFGGKQRRITLGDVHKLDADKARAAAKDRLAQVTLGGDPQADKAMARAKAAVTLGTVVDTYLTTKRTELRPKSFDETERYLRKYWRPLHGLPIHRIARDAVAARLTKIKAKNGPIAATRARAAMSALLGWAMREGLVAENVILGTNRPAEPKSRDRVLTNAELGEIWAACRDDDYGRIIRLLILTGQRRDEVGGVAWSEIDDVYWRIPGERTKNKRVHTVPLAPVAVSILKGIDRRDGKDRVFGTGDAGFGGWSKAKAALDRRVLDARSRAAGKSRTPIQAVTPIAPWTVHDIRRSVATHMAEIGVQPHIIEAVLNHVSGHKAGVAGIYNRATYEREVKAALALWADHVGSVTERSERKVVAFPQTSRT
jgi:integrase